MLCMMFKLVTGAVHRETVELATRIQSAGQGDRGSEIQKRNRICGGWQGSRLNSISAPRITFGNNFGLHRLVDELANIVVQLIGQQIFNKFLCSKLNFVVVVHIGVPVWLFEFRKIY